MNKCKRQITVLERNKIMTNLKGLRWYKADLHLHTVASICFADRSVTAEQWINECIEKGLNCVAVTDHNTGDGIDAIKEAANGQITVFPGVEVTCGDSKQHLLVLFDPKHDTTYVNEFLSLIGITSEIRGKQDAISSKSIFEIAAIANSRGGISIAAHIDQFNGLGSLAHIKKQEVVDNEFILGVQIVHPFLYEESMPDTETLRNKFSECYNNISKTDWHCWVDVATFYKNKSIAKLTFSDNPAGEKESKHGLYGIGNRFTWIKMDEQITIESLKQALLMPNLRIINDMDYDPESNFHPNTYIQYMEIKNTIYNGDIPQKVHFNPQLTTIVGGRGTGKSSILRLIRNNLNKSDELKEYVDLYNDHKEFCRVADNSSGIFKANGNCTLHIKNGKSLYILSSEINSNGNFEYHLRVIYSNGTEYQVPPEQISNLLEKLNIQIFSQKQIYEISRNTNALREFIDKNLDDVDQLKQQIRNLEDKYTTNISEIWSLKKLIAQKPSLEIKLSELEIENAGIDSEKNQLILENSNNFNTENTLYKKLLESIEYKIELINSSIEQSTFELPLDNFRDEYHTFVKEMNSKVSVDMEKVNLNLNNQLQALIKLKDELNSNILNSMWNTNFKKHKEIEESEGNIVGTLQTKKNLLNQIAEIKSEIENLTSYEQQIIQINIANQNIVSEILKLRSDTRNKRQIFTNGILINNHLLKSDIKAYRDMKDFEMKLRKYLMKNNFESDFEKIVNFVFNGQVTTKVNQLADIFLKIEQENTLGLSKRFASLIKNMQPEEIDRLRILYPEDDVVLSYKISESGNFKPLSNASAGQKTSAILTLILSTGDYPIILDQPEDDLDNSLISDLIVDRILHTKKNRQVIVVTHNANIPVNADSDLINVMNSDFLSLEPLVYGCIDNIEVKNKICDIMEGGVKAFKSRATRYNIKMI